ncbi:MAG: hypothetical protein NDF54_10470 [archaeon GB-1867-035]|nr:hypothetical protein [Candidatus Culexmicrobium profundum]
MYLHTFNENDNALKVLEELFSKYNFKASRLSKFFGITHHIDRKFAEEIISSNFRRASLVLNIL